MKLDIRGVEKEMKIEFEKIDRILLEATFVLALVIYFLMATCSDSENLMRQINRLEAKIDSVLTIEKGVN